MSRPFAHLRSDAVPAFEAHAVTHRYGSGTSAVTALEDVAFSVPAGAFTSVIGANGSGKSTLFRMFSGLRAPTAGNVRVFGCAPRLAAEHLGVVFQSPALDPQLTVFENLHTHALLYGLRVRRAGLDPEILERLELGGLLDRRVNTLSGGYQRRVELAKVLTTSPRALVLDEPGTGLDAVAQERWNDLLLRMSRERGLSVLVVTHDLVFAGRSDRVLLLDRGRLVADDTPDALVRPFGTVVLDVHGRGSRMVAERCAQRLGTRSWIVDDRRVVLSGAAVTDVLPCVDFERDGIDGIEARRPTLADASLAVRAAMPPAAAHSGGVPVEEALAA